MTGRLIEFKDNTERETLRAAFADGLKMDVPPERREGHVPVAHDGLIDSYHVAANRAFAHKLADLPSTTVRYVPTEAVPAAFRPAKQDGLS